MKLEMNAFQDGLAGEAPSLGNKKTANDPRAAAVTSFKSADRAGTATLCSSSTTNASAMDAAQMISGDTEGGSTYNAATDKMACASK